MGNNCLKPTRKVVPKFEITFGNANLYTRYPENKDDAVTWLETHNELVAERAFTLSKITMPKVLVADAARVKKFVLTVNGKEYRARESLALNPTTLTFFCFTQVAAGDTLTYGVRLELTHPTPLNNLPLKLNFLKIGLTAAQNSHVFEFFDDLNGYAGSYAYNGTSGPLLEQSRNRDFYTTSTGNRARWTYVHVELHVWSGTIDRTRTLSSRRTGVCVL